MLEHFYYGLLFVYYFYTKCNCFKIKTVVSKKIYFLLSYSRFVDANESDIQCAMSGMYESTTISCIFGLTNIYFNRIRFALHVLNNCLLSISISINNILLNRLLFFIFVFASVCWLGRRSAARTH